MGRATSPEGIARQHSDALTLLRTPCAPISNRGEIPLAWKVRPSVVDAVGKGENGETSHKSNGGAGDTVCSCNGGGSSYVESSGGNGRSNDATAVVADEGCFWWSTRGIVDVAALADLVREGYDDPAPPPPQQPNQTKDGSKGSRNGNSSSSSRPATKDPAQPPAVRSRTNLWDAINAAGDNVHVTRPSHDAWGIKKVVLIFCDDFLQDVYEMPWWHNSEKSNVAAKMRSAVQPILDALNVDQSRVVRMLLAALPPGVTIPVHHDTGEWVRHTHRVHVPVLVTNSDKVLFRCGPAEDRMDRIDCRVGHVFEINNQGKHAVSNCGTDHRVHLILDYVDKGFDIKRRLQLSPGEKVIQTRRSIDRQVDYGTRPTPSYLIIGAQKAGTTSMYDYLCQHPLVVKARRRETHCFDWRWDDSLRSTEKRRAHCQKFYYTEELKPHPSLLTGDSTPSYLLDSLRVIPRLKEVFPHDPKLIVMVRDPVKRAKSHFEMVTSLDGSPEQIKNRGTEWLNLTFEEVIARDFNNMKEDGLIPYWDRETGTVNQEAFDSFVGSEEEDAAWERYLSTRIPIKQGSHSPVTRGMYELQLRRWFDAYPRDHILILKLEDMAREGGVQHSVDLALAHLGLPQYKVADETAKNTRSYCPMKKETEEMLKRFYAPHNKRLGKLLDGFINGNGEKHHNPWPY